MDWLTRSGEQTRVVVGALRELQQALKKNEYEPTERDLAAISACAKDLRPMGYALGASMATFWLTGLLPRPRSGAYRVAAAVARVALAGEAFRVGDAVGTFRCGADCVRRMVALPTPMGGEMAAILRAKDPASPLLKFERPPPDVLEDGSRPRIASEANRLAKLAAAARRAEDGGGARAAGDEAARPGPGPNTSASARGGTGSPAGELGGQGSSSWEQADGMRQGGEGAAGGSVFDLLGMSAAQDSPEADEQAQAEAAAPQQERRRRRRRRWVRTHDRADD
jgi:hypothetical protein